MPQEYWRPLFGEPDVAVRSSRDVGRKAVGGGKLKLRHDSRGGDATDTVAVEFGEPQVSVRSSGYAGRRAVGGNREFNVLPTTTQTPDQFGTANYTITSISALVFSGESYIPVAPLSRTGKLNVSQHFYAMLEVPAGVIIGYLGLNNFNDGTPAVIGVTLWRRTILGATPFLAAVSNSPHSYYATDSNSTPAGIKTDSQPLIVDVAIAASPNPQYFGFVEARWRRTVSPAPLIASFSDVPTTHPFFQYIEALFTSGITAGCQTNPPRYCPDSPVTRAQMAVFLAKALGL